MKSYEEMSYHKVSDELVKILQEKTLNSNPLMFRVMVAYYFSKIASMMRININTHERGVLPVNMYAVNLALSGEGKGHATNIIEEQVIDKFKTRFLHDTFPALAEVNLRKLANERAVKKGEDPDAEYDKVKKEFDNLGELAFSFDSGTVPAVKQMRHKLLMANAGSMNMEIDEIGSNLLSNSDVLTTYLELFDIGKVKNKLTKNTSENIRNTEIDGRTPTNMMLFGTPSKLLDGGKTEEEFISMLETGYARRCIFSFHGASSKVMNMTPEETYDLLTNNSSNSFLQFLSDLIWKLADPLNFNKTINISKDVTLIIIAYKQACEEIALGLPDHQEIQRIELNHRYFKATKLAGTYAYIDASPEITEEHIYNAIKLVEDSGKAFKDMLTRERNYVKLARYIASVDRDVTHVDLMEDMPCYKGGEGHRRDLLNLAVAYGYRNNIIIKRSIVDNIEFLRGESIKAVDMDKIRISYGTQLADNYINEEIKFSNFGKLTQQPNYHWVNHFLLEGYRKEENCIMGCDVIVLDIDEGVSIETAQLLLREYTYHIHTTKRHTPTNHRFRIIMPLSHRIKLDASDFKEFMKNIYEWLPFKIDEQTNQRSRKWATHPGATYDNVGESLNALTFIPKTSKCDEHKQVIASLHNLNNMERWFINQTDSGNRSNNLIRYALMLVDSGMDISSVQNNVLALNSKLKNPLDETEVLSTIMVSATKAFINKSRP